jgi:hypothetical protein
MTQTTPRPDALDLPPIQAAPRRRRSAAAVVGLLLCMIPAPLAAQRLAFALDVTYAAGASPSDVVIADFDGDGILDLAVVNSAAGSVSVLLGNDVAGVPDGTFAPALDAAAGSSPTRLAVGDFDGNDVLDLVVAHNGPDLSVLLGLGDGSFGPPVSHASGSVVHSGVTVADLDGDGILDLVVSHWFSDAVGVLLGQGSGGVGDGTFAPAVAYATGELPRDVVVADFDGDGILDLAAACFDDASVSVLLGSGDGTFSGAADYPAGAAGLAIVAADFDGDGITDLALQSHLDGTVSVLLGQGSGGVGDGTFGAPIASTAGLAPTDLATGDFDADGVMDLAVANAGNGLNAVLLGVGDGSFETPRFYQADSQDTTSQPFAVATADLEADGALDFVTANMMNANVSVMRNLGQAPAAGFLRITELMIDPDQVGDGDGEYLELFNAAEAPIHLHNWTIEDSAGTLGFLSGSIGPGQLFTIGASDDLDGGGFAPDLVPLTFPSLGNDGDVITVRDTAGEIFAQVAYTAGNAFGPGVAYELANLEAAVAGVSEGAYYVGSTTPFGADFGSPGALGGTSTASMVTVTPSAGPNGGIDPDQPQSVAVLETLAFDLTPDSGFLVGPVGGSCGGTLAGGVFTTDALVADCTVAASFLAISTSTLAPVVTPVRLGEPVTFSVEVDSAAGPPDDGMVEIVATTGEGCVDPSPDPPPGPTFACDLAFATVGTRSVTASFSGSATHAASTSAAVDVDVKRFADLSVTVDDGQTTWVEGEPSTYLIELRNDGPDEAPNTQLVALAMPELDDPEWECTALGGAICPAAGGPGLFDEAVAVLPPGGGLDVLQVGTVPEGWTGAVVVGVEAAVADAFPDEVYDPDPSNNLATDLDHPALVFEDGFESGDTSAWTATTP